MKIDIINEKENPLMKRRELLVSIDFDKGSTPSKADLQKFLAEQLKANIENLEVSKVLSESGLPKGKAWIKIWKEKKIPLYSEIKKEKKGTPKEESKAETKEETKKEEK